MDSLIANSGAWSIAVIIIVFASWFLYRFLAPTTWREWAGAGIVQAFIIALYAEMYGFPLTIYLLVRFFGLDRSTLSANLWSTLFGAGETPMYIFMAIGYSLAIAGIALFAKGWSELYKARKEKKLATAGLYRLMRHPQYTGLFIILFGEGIVHWPTVFSVTLFPIIVIAYVLLANREEKQMCKEFGEAYKKYKAKTPAFIPNISLIGQLIQNLGKN